MNVLKIGQISTLFICFFFFQQIGCMAAENQINIKGERIKVRQALDIIKGQTGFYFMYEENSIDKDKLIELNLSNVGVRQAMDEIARRAGFFYEIMEDYILIKKSKRSNPAILINDRKTPEQSKKTEITGKVVDESKNTLPGVIVRLQGTEIVTTTKENGNFSLSVPDTVAPLIEFSFIGMKKQVVRYKGKPMIITLEENVTELAEVVAVGYFNRRRDSFTGSAITISGGELKKVNPNNLLQSIESFDPSFRILTDNLLGSDPNRLPAINVRGTASVPTGGSGEVLRRDNISSNVNMPTFILDGYEVGVEKIYDLDVNRVASISLLKDAAATAIYGSRASNGVLVITTVTPKEGKIKVSYNYEMNASFPDLTSYDMLNAKDKLEYERLAGVYEMEGISLQDQRELYYQKYFNVVSGVDTYWLSQPVRNALGNKHSLYIEGGSSTIRYGINGQYQTSPGVMKKSGRDRLGLGVDLSYNNNNKLLFKNVLSFSNVSGNDSPYGNFAEYVRMNPYYPKTDDRGQIVQEIDSWTDRSGEGGSTATEVVLNPLYDATLSSFSKSKYWEINDAVTAEWNIMTGLRLRGLFSITQKNTTNDQFVSPYDNEFFFYTGNRLSDRGRYTYTNKEETYVDANATLTYNKQINDHFINLALGANIRTGNINQKSFTAIGFTNDRFTDIGYAKGYEEGASPSTAIDKERLFGSFLSLNYSFKERYLLDASFRADGSSKFGTDNKVAPFWAAGIGWNLHNEEFIKKLKLFSQLRIKANTGLTGSVSFSPFMANTLYQYYKDNWYSTGVGVTVSQYGNDKLKWQRTQNYDIGIDIGLLGDRIYASARYYNKLTKDMLTDVTLPPSTGFSSYKDNLGDIKNMGYELGLKWNIYKNKDWNVELNGNFAHNKNKLVKISNSLKKLNEAADNSQQSGDNMGIPLLRYNEGQSINTIYAVRSKGIDPENGKEIFVKKDGTLTYDWDVKDVVPICDATPKLEGYFGGSVFYRGFLLNVSFYTRFGGYDYNQTLIDKVENADPRYNLDKRAMEHRWVNPGDNALYKNIRDWDDTRVTERFIQKDNVLEFRSIYLSYDIKAKFMDKIGIETLRAAITANDFWRMSSITTERGINYPFARSFTFSIQTNF